MRHYISNADSFPESESMRRKTRDVKRDKRNPRKAKGLRAHRGNRRPVKES